MLGISYRKSAEALGTKKGFGMALVLYRPGISSTQRGRWHVVLQTAVSDVFLPDTLMLEWVVDEFC